MCGGGVQRIGADSSFAGYLSARRQETRRYELTTGSDAEVRTHQAAGRSGRWGEEIPAPRSRIVPGMLRPAPGGGLTSR
jgi:hypothetical protein